MYSKKELEHELNSGDEKKITDCLLYITFNIDDFEWVQDILLQNIDHPNNDVSGLAITCLGHLARIHSKIDKEKVIPRLKLKAKNKKLSGRVEDALDDINMFS